MKHFLTVLLLVFSLPICAQTDKKVDSKITTVTVFLNRAQVTREVKTRLAAGKTNIIVTGLAAQLDPQSIQVSAKGSFTINGISHQQNYLNEFNVPRTLKVLRDSIDLLQRQISIENTQKEILSREEQMLNANQKIGGTSQNLTAAEVKAMADFYRTRMTEIIMLRARHDERIITLNERLSKLQRQLASENELYTRNTSEIVVSVSASAETPAELGLSYVVANAGWQPVYDIRGTNTKSPLALSYKANVFQSTGEQWRDVRLKLSTANPAISGSKPELSPWYLNFYEPRPRPVVRRDRSQMAPKMSDAPSVAAQEQVYELEEADRVSDYVTTVQTSLSTEFDIALPYTVLSASKPTLVDIRNHEIKSDYIYSCAPKLESTVFLMARATGWESLNLLPGEANIFFEGTFVAKSYIDPNSIKDTLSISLGRDPRIVVKRQKLQDFSSRKTIGTNQRAAYTFELSVRNTRSEDINIIVEDQVPVSQNGQIEVTVSDVGGAKWDKTTGKLTWELAVKANETNAVRYAYEVKYPKDRIIAGLE